MNDNPKDEARMAREWADITIDRWLKKTARLKIGNTGALVRSFTSSVIADARGDVQKIAFTFLYYGIFVDMGVGRGTNLQQVGLTNRKKKPWYSPVVRREIYKLGELMIENYGVKALGALRLVEQTITYSS